MKRYKLTDANMQTYNHTQWEIGTKRTASGCGELCGPGWLHVYTDPRLAVLLNPIHAYFGEGMRLFECECDGLSKTDRGLKEGWQSVTLTREIPLPAITIEQRVEFAIRCALEVYNDSSFVAWANNWISGKDRSAAAVRAAEAAARAAAAVNIDLVAICNRVLGGNHE